MCLDVKGDQFQHRLWAGPVFHRSRYVYINFQAIISIISFFIDNNLGPLATESPCIILRMSKCTLKPFLLSTHADFSWVCLFVAHIRADYSSCDIASFAINETSVLKALYASLLSPPGTPRCSSAYLWPNCSVLDMFHWNMDHCLISGLVERFLLLPTDIHHVRLRSRKYILKYLWPSVVTNVQVSKQLSPVFTLHIFYAYR